jgi:hypothetical protein
MEIGPHDTMLCSDYKKGIEIDGKHRLKKSHMLNTLTQHAIPLSVGHEGSVCISAAPDVGNRLHFEYTNNDLNIQIGIGMIIGDLKASSVYTISAVRFMEISFVGCGISG